MRKTLSVIAALAVSSVAMPAFAADTIWLDSDHSAYSNGQTTSGSFAFSGGGVTVHASAWSIQNNNTLEDETLGIWTPGLGIYSGSPNRWGQYSDEHVLDNNGVDEFVLLAFDQVVNLSDVLLNTGYDSLRDTDLTVGFATIAFPLPGLDEKSSSYLSSVAGLGLDLYSVTGGSSSGWRDINPTNSNAGNLWLIGGKFGSSNDGFKLNALKFTTPTPPPAVPEPATWLMMILGFGLVGGVMRSKRRENLTVSYS
jgi:hypothetical protein